MTKRYTSLVEFRDERTLAREERDRSRDRLAQRWALIQDPHTRGVLLKDAMGDMLRSWSPYRRVHDLFHGRLSGTSVAAVGMAVASAQQGMGRRLLFSGLSMLLGKALGDKPKEGEGLLHSVASAVGRGVRFIHERKAARQERQQDAVAVEDQDDHR